MENKILDKNFYKQDSVTVAKQLIGKILCVEKDNQIIRKRDYRDRGLSRRK